MGKNTTTKGDKETKKGGMLDLDISHLLPKGYEAADLVKVGGLRPIASAEVSYDEESPIAGHLVTLLDMPPRQKIGARDGEKEPWQAILVRLTSSTKALVGDEIVEVAVGKDILIPINGNLRNNIDLLGAAVDPKNVWFVIAYVEGKVPMKDGRNDMWSYDVQIHKKVIARDGAFALFNRQERYRPQLDAKSNDGQVFDAKTGEVRSAVGPAAG